MIDPILLFIIFFGTLGVTYFILFRYSLRSAIKVTQNMKRLAKELNFEFIKERSIIEDIISFFKKPSWNGFLGLFKSFFLIGFRTNKVIGNLDFFGRTYTIEIGTKILKIKEFSVPATYVEIKPLKSGEFFDVSNKDIFHNIEKLWIKDIQFNVPEFDKRYLIFCENETFMRKVFDNNVISLFLMLHKNVLFHLENGVLYFEEEGYIQDYDYFKKVILINLLLLQNIENASM
ncbi:MAG: hypothetical protein QXS41_03285 [Candidatus Woesearchaeota archaeon]